MDVGEKKVFVKKIQNTVFGTIYLDVGEKKVFVKKLQNTVFRTFVVLI